MHLESHSLHRSITQENVQQRSPAPTRTSQVNIARNLSVCLHACTQALQHIDWAHSLSLDRSLSLVSWHNHSLHHFTHPSSFARTRTNHRCISPTYLIFRARTDDAAQEGDVNGNVDPHPYQHAMPSNSQGSTEIGHLRVI